MSVPVRGTKRDFSWRPTCIECGTERVAVVTADGHLCAECFGPVGISRDMDSTPRPTIDWWLWIRGIAAVGVMLTVAALSL